jgi:hypothetical protein
MSIEEAIKQLSFHKSKGADIIKEVLHEHNSDFFEVAFDRFCQHFRLY